MRRLLLTLTLCSLPLTSLAPLPAMAATAAASQVQSIRNLQQLETLSYKAATSFYLYSVLNRDPSQLKRMQGELASGDVLVQKIGVGGITSRWNELKRTTTNAKFTSEGVADNPSINAVDAALSTLTQTIRTIEAEQRTAGNIATDKMADMLYDQYVLMQVMTAAYLRKSADYFGGAIVLSQGPQVEIDKLAARFSSQLDQLNKHYAKNPQVSATLKEVTTKWTFIKGSFVNFNQDNVPFIVGRYNEQITDRLLTAYEQLLP
ncbi:MAG: hypothetical protein REI12_14630 [Pedobacter sp.]|nr:hypothetical protein [Pedobacter sp.]